MTTTLHDELQQAAGLAELEAPAHGAAAARDRARVLQRRRAATRVGAPVLGLLVAVAALPSLTGGDGSPDSVRTVPPAEGVPTDDVTVDGETAGEVQEAAKVPTDPAMRSPRAPEPQLSVGTPQPDELATVPGAARPSLDPRPAPARPPAGTMPRAGSFAFVRDNDIWLTEAGSTRRLTNDAAYERHHPSWSPDGGTIAYARSQRVDNDRAEVGYEQAQDLWVVDVRSGTEKLLLADGHDPTWLPDGRIMFEREQPSGGVRGPGTTEAPQDGEDWTVAADGTNAVRWSGPGNAAFSPDGRRLAYPCGTNAVCVANADGSGEQVVSRSVTDDFSVSMLSWSADQRWLSGGNGFSLKIIDLGERKQHVVRDQGGLWPSWSPDGSTVVFGTVHDGRLNAVDRDGRNLRSVGGDHDRYGAWSR